MSIPIGSVAFKPFVHIGSYAPPCHMRLSDAGTLLQLPPFPEPSRAELPNALHALARILALLGHAREARFLDISNKANVCSYRRNLVEKAKTQEMSCAVPPPQPQICVHLYENSVFPGKRITCSRT
jgi:hypothetical protein